MEDCIFCKIAQGSAASWKVYEDAYTCAFFNIHPVNDYHTLVIPKKHYTDIFDITGDDLAHVLHTVKAVVDLYHDQLGMKNIQVINSSGAEAQQDVFHLHFHIVPRTCGDGQDIKWSTDPEGRNKFDSLLEKLKK